MSQVVKMPDGEMVRMRHLSPEDRRLFTKYLVKNQPQVKRIKYDVEVGAAVGPEGIAYAYHDEKYRRLLAKRIDVVMEYDERTDICEVKPRAGAMAMGQLLLYVDLYQKGKHGKTTARAVIITDQVDPDARDLIERQGIQIEEVGI